MRFLLRVPLKTLEGRRKARQVYITASMSFSISALSSFLCRSDDYDY
jgi:hypothetical protein